MTSYNLQTELEKLRSEVVSERYSMSIGELAGLYERDELNIHPKFQRILRWSDHQKSRLIESILLRIPIPPIFVAQDPDGRWDVVDGVQRLGSIFEFIGILQSPDGDIKPPLKLSATELLKSLDNVCFKSENSQQPQFTDAQRLDFRRARLDIQIILKESDPSAKYELFERLNTGGSIASNQEVRNCVLVWTNESIYDWLLEITSSEPFTSAVSISDRMEEQEYHTELLLRLIVFYNIDENDLKDMRDVGDFLNIKNRAIATNPDFDTKKIGNIITDTMNYIVSACGADSFRKFDPNRDRYVGGFLISVFEAVAFGIAYNIDGWRSYKGDRDSELLARIQNIWSDTDFTESIGTGVAARPRLQRTIPFGRKVFQP